jgi:hypothetical protein
VHDVAVQLVDEFAAAWPSFKYDAQAVAFGAATHDLGKALHPGELTGAGSEHEASGHRWLLEHGVPERLARFARTHAKWDDATVEDQLVSLADKIWKGRRQDDLEQLIVARIAAASSEKAWDVFMKFDDVLSRIAAGADERLEYQQRP